MVTGESYYFYALFVASIQTSLDGPSNEMVTVSSFTLPSTDISVKRFEEKVNWQKQGF